MTQLRQGDCQFISSSRISAYSQGILPAEYPQEVVAKRKVDVVVLRVAKLEQPITTVQTPMRLSPPPPIFILGTSRHGHFLTKWTLRLERLADVAISLANKAGG